MKTNSEQSADRSGSNSKLMRIFLVLVTALLVFAGPTYVPYVLGEVLKLNTAVAIAFGFVLLAAGLVLMWHLIRKKAIE